MRDTNDAPTVDDRDDPLAVTARHARAQAAESGAWARERLVWVRAVQEQTREVREQTAVAIRRAEMASEQAMGVYVGALEAWARSHEVLALSESAGAAARALRPRAS